MVLAVVDVLAWLGAAVLVAAGLLKLKRPLPAAGFLLRLRLPASPRAVRVAAALEVAAVRFPALHDRPELGHQTYLVSRQSDRYVAWARLR